MTAQLVALWWGQPIFSRTNSSEVRLATSPLGCIANNCYYIFWTSRQREQSQQRQPHHRGHASINRQRHRYRIQSRSCPAELVILIKCRTTDQNLHPSGPCPHQNASAMRSSGDGCRRPCTGALLINHFTRILILTAQRIPNPTCKQWHDSTAEGGQEAVRLSYHRR